MSEHQPSMTEWLASIGEEAESNAFREEDNRKVARLEVLHQTIGLQYERPVEFAARDLADLTPAFAAFLAERGDNLCALRLVPTKEGLPKLRNRGLTLRTVYETWFKKQAINPADYRAFVAPHSETLLWSAIFMVNRDAIFGELIAGMHTELTHGDTTVPVSRFRYDFKNWQWQHGTPEAQSVIRRMLKMIHVADAPTQALLSLRLGSRFSGHYLQGYFEGTVWPGDIVYVTDYNRRLPVLIPTPPPFCDVQAAVKGMPAYAGSAEGRVRVVTPENLQASAFAQGDILVADNTDIRFVPLMQRAGAIVTNRGGMLSHASIVARELRVPCIVGTGNATKFLHDGDWVEVDAQQGVVRKVVK